MPDVWTKMKSVAFWAKRKWKLVIRDEQRNEHIANYQAQRDARKQRIEDDKQAFCDEYAEREPSDNAPTELYEKEGKDLEFWMVHGSWTYCKNCKQLISQKLFPRFARRPMIKAAEKRTCKENRYKAPKYKDVPKELRHLTYKQMVALRPLDIHTGDYIRQRSGYRQKGGMFRLSWSQNSPLQKINALPEEEREQCQKAYDWLIVQERSSY